MTPTRQFRKPQALCDVLLLAAILFGGLFILHVLLAVLGGRWRCAFRRGSGGAVVLHLGHVISDHVVGGNVLHVILRRGGVTSGERQQRRGEDVNFHVRQIEQIDRGGQLCRNQGRKPVAIRVELA